MERVGDVIEKAKRSARGRQDRSGQEKVIDMSKLTDRMAHLVKLHISAKEEATAFSDAVKAVAEKSGLLASVVRRVVTAKAGEAFEEKQKEAEQLALVFGEVAA